MAIWQMCDENAPGAVKDEYWSRLGETPIFKRESHVGLVLETGEYNGYDDSDFYAVVWNAEKGETERIVYATTRGWTYPNSATVDATPEVLAAYEAYQEKRREEYRKAREACDAATPTKGKRVVVLTSRKIPKGTEAEVFWYGRDKMGRHIERPFADLDAKGRREGYRVGLLLPDGTKTFVSATTVEVKPPTGHKHRCMHCDAVLTDGNFDCEGEGDHDFGLCEECVKDPDARLAAGLDARGQDE